MNSAKFLVLNLLVAASVAAIAAAPDKATPVVRVRAQVREPYGADPAQTVPAAASGSSMKERREGVIGEPYMVRGTFVSTKTRAEVKEELRIARARGEISVGEPYPIK
jgi:hypothetical protein